MSATLNLDKAIQECERQAETDHLAQAFESPHAAARAMSATPPGNLAEFRTKVDGMGAGGIWLLLAQYTLQILQEYGPQALAYLLELLKRKIPVGP